MEQQLEPLLNGLNPAIRIVQTGVGGDKWSARRSPCAPQNRGMGDMRLTDKTAARLRLEHGETDRVWWDEDISGFGIRLRDGGSRTWIYRYRIGSKQRSVILGSATAVPLAVARKNASGLAARIRLGEDPALDRDNARLEADNTFGVLAQQYLETRKAEWRPVTYTEIKRHLTKYAKSLHRVPTTAVSQRNIANLLNGIAKDAGDVTANRVRGRKCRRRCTVSVLNTG